MVNVRYLSVQSETDEHEEQEDSPKLGERHLGHDRRVHDQGKTQTWRCVPKFHI